MQANQDSPPTVCVATQIVLWNESPPGLLRIGTVTMKSANTPKEKTRPSRSFPSLPWLSGTCLVTVMVLLSAWMSVASAAVSGTSSLGNSARFERAPEHESDLGVDFRFEEEEEEEEEQSSHSQGFCCVLASSSRLLEATRYEDSAVFGFRSTTNSQRQQNSSDGARAPPAA